VVPEARFEQLDNGVVPVSEGWYVANARELAWWERPGRGVVCPLDGGHLEFPQVGVNLFVLGPGEPMSMYHWEADQEDFLVLSGEALLLIEGEERPLRAWDFVHCPPNASHTIVGAGAGPCTVLAIGARDRSVGPPGSGWGGYPVDDAALRHDAGVEEETDDAAVAYARYPGRQAGSYPPGALPE
jgi:uncharacterized cupin superfamily protein